jgi:hypothetical protein
LIAAVAGLMTTQAQTVLNESFTATWTPSTAGWTATNVSIPATTTQPSGWFQGNPATFTANSGGTADYYASNYQIGGNSGSNPADLNAWLITPTVSLTNGGVFQFATRRVVSTFADRLQIRWSAGTGTAVGTTTAAPGTFTNMILDINPNYTVSNTSAVSNGSVNGYPETWSVFSLTLTGLPSATVGRFAFRYLVQNGGGGANSDYIGIDDVTYSLPCTQPTITVNPPSATICSGATTTLFASGATTYTWAPSGITGSVAAVSPTATTIYTVTGATLGCTNTRTVQVTVNATPTVAVNNATICSGSSATLMASGATTYSWNTGATTSSIVVSPAVNTTYTVTGTNATCVNTKTVSVTIGSALSINVSASPTAICSGASTTLTASGATTYSWNTGAATSSIVVSPGVTTSYTVGGVSGACAGFNTITVTVNPSPVLTASSSVGPVACVSTTIILTGSGATSYTWALGSASNSVAANPISLNTGTAAGVANLTLTGVNASGCSASIPLTQTISLCTGLNENTVASDITVFPNPFKNELTINGIAVDTKVEVMNALGQVVLTASVKDNKTINTATLAKGIYFIKVEQGASRAKTIKVIKE